MKTPRNAEMFPCSLGGSVKGLTIFLSLLMAGLFVLLVGIIPPQLNQAGETLAVPVHLLAGLAIIMISGVSFLLAPRRYELWSNALVVRRRSGHGLCFPYAELECVDYPLARSPFRWSWKLWANGGFFALQGWFMGGPLRRFRAQATNTANAVVVQRHGASPLVLTPDAPEAFVEALSRRLGSRPAQHQHQGRRKAR